VQLRTILFERLRLPTTDIRRTQTGFSTAAAELMKLAGSHPIIEALAEYRELTKLLTTYIATLPALVDKRTGRLYASFNQTVAATGRLSSSDPNLQNIPIKTALGQEIRAAFVAKRGSRLVKADYSQIELRLAAHIAHDEKMIETFRAGLDIHAATAAWVYGVPPDQVNAEQRREAKTLNFGVLYGMGAQAFAREAGMSVERARSFIGRYKEQYAGITRMVEETIRQTREQGYVETLFGRKRYIPEIQSRDQRIRAQAERIAFNFPLQGTQADILKKAMIALHAAFKERFPAVKLILTVHDELVAEAPATESMAVAELMKRTMESVISLDVPLVVEVGIGANWRDIKKASLPKRGVV
jgi:DNA polymerase-1